jgi:hypothetical protein
MEGYTALDKPSRAPPIYRVLYFIEYVEDPD